MNDSTDIGARHGAALALPAGTAGNGSAPRSGMPRTLPVLLALIAAAGCASTKVTKRETLVTEKLPRPAHIYIHDFTARSADVPGDSAIAGQHAEHSSPQTAEEIEAGRKLGEEIATQLIAEIRAMGLPAERGAAGTQPKVNDIVIRGYLLSIEEGSAAKRIAIGFGSGTSELKTLVEGFQMTPQGLRKLGSGETDAGGGKAPGSAVGIAGLIATGNPAGLIVSTGMKVYGEKSGKSTIGGRAKATATEIGDQLKPRFREEGWIH